MGIKERRTKILLALFLLTSESSSSNQVISFSPVTFDGKIQTAFDIALNQKTRGTLSGLLKEGLIEKEGDNQYRLTDKGFEEISLQFPFCRYLRKKWDGKWRIISYEIPESKREIRDRLRREMQGWGLGPWHRSFWLTPHPIIDTLHKLVSQKEEEKYIQTFEADHAFGDREILIEKVWGKTALDKKYRELFKKWHETLSKDLPAGKQEDPKLEKLKKVIIDYVGVLKEDPGLPVELLGEKWIGLEAFNIYKEIKSILFN
jgi:phenylacetic acid degradation operon negative regulatory protein